MTTTRSNRFLSLTHRCANAVGEVDWETTLGIPDGACIPVAVFCAAFYSSAGIQARPVECGFRVTDPLNVRWAEPETTTGEDVMAARDEKGLGFLGHMCVQLPTLRLAVDMSLPTQRQTVLTNLGGAPDVVIGRVDHTKGEDGFRAKIGTADRGVIAYRLYPRRDGWAKRRWPYEWIRTFAVEVERGMR